MSPILALIILIFIAALLWRIAKFVAKLVLVVVVVLAIYFLVFGEDTEAKTFIEAPTTVTSTSAV